MRGSIWGVFAGLVLVALVIAAWVMMHGIVMLEGLAPVFTGQLP